jgi:hypothetical protein
MRNEESDNYTSLHSKNLNLERKFGEVLSSTKPSWKLHAAEMADDATWLLRKHQFEGTTKMYRFNVNCKTSDYSRSPTHWTSHRSKVQDESVCIHPNPNKVSKHLCNTKETESWSQIASARNPNTTKPQIGCILSCFDWYTVCFFRLQPHILLPQTEDDYVTMPMFL